MKQNKNKNIWEIETSDGKHIIKANMGATARDPIVILVDNERVTTVQFIGKGMIPNMERSFLCGTETVTMVLHGSTIDMVFRGKFLNHKIEYNPQDALPKWFRILAVVLSFASIAECWLLPIWFELPIKSQSSSLAFLMIFMCTIIAINRLTTPFYSKRKKLLCGFLFVLWSWLLTFLIVAFM